jgi:transposase
LDRDLNAAINIKKYSLKSVLPGIGRENQKELPTLVGVMTSEVK